MKRTGRHPDKELTAVRVRSLVEPGRYADGNGLYLLVEPSGSRRWVLRVVVKGRRRDIGLGGAQVVSLAEARETALALRKVARRGGDPVAERRRAKGVPTFAEAAEQVHESHGGGWRNAKHAAQWINTLRTYAFPIIGDQRVDAVTTADLLRVLQPIWLTKGETARRVRQRMAAVFDWAKTAGFREGENPLDGIERGLPRQGVRVEHHAALPFRDVPAFVRRLRASNCGETVKLAFELLILTAVRTGELINAAWSEFDIDGRVWVVPAARMKAGREHRVPLSNRALEVLAEAKKLSADRPLVFPGRSPARAMSNMAFLMALRRIGEPVTAHGFRSAFRDWASERTHFPREVCEAALAHTVRDKVEAAYRRGDLFEKRRQLMASWSAFVASAGTVIALRAG